MKSRDFGSISTSKQQNHGHKERYGEPATTTCSAVLGLRKLWSLALPMQLLGDKVDNKPMCIMWNQIYQNSLEKNNRKRFWTGWPRLRGYLSTKIYLTIIVIIITSNPCPYHLGIIYMNSISSFRSILGSSPTRLHLFRSIPITSVHFLLGHFHNGPLTCVEKLFLTRAIADLCWTCPNCLKRVSPN